MNSDPVKVGIIIEVTVAVVVTVIKLIELGHSLWPN
jgi:hypothetical protein